MNSEQISVVEECAAASASGRMHFGDVVARLLAAGVERYHVDYTRRETTYYTAAGGSHILPMTITHEPIASAFSAAQVEAGVRQSQRGEIMYPEFTRQALAAGCVGYFVLLTGKCVQYFGRKGEIHTEWFPGAGPK